MNTKVKICGLRDHENIKEVLALEPDFMGFIFYKGSPRFAGNKFTTAIARSLPDSIFKVGVFVNELSHRILQIAAKYSLDYVQLHGDEHVKDCELLKNEGLKVIKAIPVSNQESLRVAEKYDNIVDYLLFDTQSENRGGSGIAFNWDILESYSLNTPYFVSGGLGVSELKLLAEKNYPGYIGVDLNSRFEKSPGIKNVQLLKEGFKYIR